MEQHVTQIEHSREFRESAQLRRLLRFLFSLHGTGESASQYRIAVEVFGRPASFDPATDPIVRVEMRRLRARLSDYYANHAEQPFRVEVPTGAYTLTIARVPTSGRRTPRVAVLPFGHNDGSAACATFAEGAADDLIYALRPDPRLTVLSRTSVFSLASRGLSRASIAEMVAADWVLTGTVLYQGSSYRVHAALHHGEQMDQVWREEWTCSEAQMPGLSELVAAAVRQQIAPGAGSERTVPARILPSAAAYLLYLQGDQLLTQRSPDAMRQAVGLFERSIAEDASYLRPRISLLETVAFRGLAGFEIIDEQPRGTRLIEECHRIDPDGSETLTGTGLAAVVFDGDYPRARALFQSATERDPYNTRPYMFYTLSLAMEGEFDAACDAARRGLRLDPFSPVLHSRFGLAALCSGRPHEAVEAFDDAIERNPELLSNRYHQAMALASIGRTDEAMNHLREAEVLAPAHPLVTAVKGHVLARTGAIDAAAEIGGRLESLSARGLVSPMLAAIVYCGRPDLAGAADMVRLSIERRSYCLLPYLTTSMMEPLRRSEGFAEVFRAARVRTSAVD